MSGPASLNSVTLSLHSCAPFYMGWCSSFPPSATVRTPEHHQLTTDGQTICQVSESAMLCFYPDSTPRSQALTIRRKGETFIGPEGNLGNMILKNQSNRGEWGSIPRWAELSLAQSEDYRKHRQKDEAVLGKQVMTPGTERKGPVMDSCENSNCIPTLSRSQLSTQEQVSTVPT